MPKKHQPGYSKIQNTYVHPSLQSSRQQSSSATPAAPQSVNERIQQLRREQAPRASVNRRDEITEVVTQRTIPPALRRILNIPEINAPLPKPGTRDRNVRTTRRAAPGPPAPTSWLHQSRHAPGNTRKTGKSLASNRMSRDFSSLATLDDGSMRLSAERSLTHLCLKTLAQHWEDLVEYEQHYLPALPIPLKEALLSYISAYATRNCVDSRSLRILFSSEPEVSGGTGGESLEILDLSYMTNANFTVANLHRYLTCTKHVSIPEDLEGLSISSKGKQKAAELLVESWEDEFSETTASIPRALSTTSFPNLKRLSLAHPGSTASWAHLLTLSTELNKITHLSLAYWPAPSLTPNATSASMVSKHVKPVSLGGTSFYSELDDDWHEAANILRRLSNNTYSLQWLDLEGCTWHKALTWGVNSSRTMPNRNTTSQRVKDEWSSIDQKDPGPDWNDKWRQITYINLSQGWVPRNSSAIMQMPAGIIPVQLLKWLREQPEIAGDGVEDGRSRWDVEDWIEVEKVARSVEDKIHAIRREGKGRYCKCGHGWEPPVAAPKKTPAMTGGT